MYEEFRITHINGPLDLRLTKEQAVVLCLVKDGEVFIEDFIRYYQSIGFDHIVLLDNGSTDGTIEKAKEFAGVTVMQTHSEFKKNKLKFKTRLDHPIWSRHLVTDCGYR